MRYGARLEKAAQLVWPCMCFPHLFQKIMIQLAPYLISKLLFIKNNLKGGSSWSGFS